MRVTSSTVADHAFRRVKRRGYDPAEVDSVMARIGDTLREYESLTSELEVSLREAEESHEAVRRTFVTAQRTKDEMLAEATAEAYRLVAAAQAESDALLAASREEADGSVAAARRKAEQLLIDAGIEAETLVADSRAEAEYERTSVTIEVEALRDRVHEETEAFASQRRREAEEMAAASRAAADRLRSQSRTAADTMLTEARDAADRLRIESHTSAEDLVAAARRESEQLRAEARAYATAARHAADQEASEVRAAAHATADDRLAAARAEAEDLVAHARDRAAVIIGNARSEREDLDLRMVQLRNAVAGVEREMHHLAATTLERAAFARSVIDLTDPDLAGRDAELPPPNGDAGRAAGEVRAVPDGSGRLPVERPEEPAARVLRLPVAGNGSGGGNGGEPKRGPTIYQRRGGGLRDRLAAGAQGAVEMEAGMEE